MTKKYLLIVAILAVAVLSVSAASPALAAEPVCSGTCDGISQGTGSGYGNQGALGTGTGIPVEQNINLDGALKDLIHENLADSLGISIEDLNARLDAGETIVEIGLDLGFTLEEISEFMVEARADALVQAVVDGLITQEQADWLASRGNRTPAIGNGDGICDGDGVCDNDCTPDGTEQKMMNKSQLKGSGK